MSSIYLLDHRSLYRIHLVTDTDSMIRVQNLGLQCNCSWKFTLDKWITVLIETQMPWPKQFNPYLTHWFQFNFWSILFSDLVFTSRIIIHFHWLNFQCFQLLRVPSAHEVGHAKWNTTGALKLRLLTDWYRSKYTVSSRFVSDGGLCDERGTVRARERE